ncbi:MAG: aspartyl/asparaginyl beta-hydroxylase domain-containing protein [Allosphingosinicella sp.]|uniref:aspartyl/asparaginyl beta-hydroxylase domain-containing protein n=1 Tax=Allosphingosinicella sp. TaxID=2823234 RepID=UPI0039418070
MAPTADPQLIDRGLDALRRGDAATARDLLSQAGQGGGRVPWLALARACSLTGDAAGEEEALQRQLEMNKRDLPALFAMAELKARQGNDRAASSFFRTAVAQAAATNPLPPQFRPLLDRAQTFLRDVGTRYEAHLTERLEAVRLDPSPRLAYALDMLRGRKPLYLQQPSMFYFPGLAQRPFFEREEFDWLPRVEAAVPALQAELRAVLAGGEEFEPYITGAPDRPLPNNKLLRDPSWGAYHFWQGGAVVQDHAARCPATMTAIEHAPMPRIAGRSPMALWSALKPGTHIEAHHGMLNTRLIVHVPLLAPEGCAIRVGHETRSWREGEALIFDDSFEHEAWNRSTELRVILLFEIWRPEISADERADLTRLFEAIDLYSAEA